MTEVLADQAAGLRQLLAPPPLRTMAVACASAWPGYGVIAADLALAIAAQGREVLLIDADNAERGASWWLGGGTERELLDGVRRELPPAQLVARRSEGVRVLRADRVLSGFAALRGEEIPALTRIVAAVCAEADAIVLSASAGKPAPLAACDSLVLVTLPDPDSVTRTYGLLKRIATQVEQARAAVIVARAPSALAAERVFANLSAAAARFLGATLEYAGSLPEAPELTQAAGRPAARRAPNAAMAAALRNCADSLMRGPAPSAAAGENAAHRFAARLAAAAGAASLRIDSGFGGGPAR